MIALDTNVLVLYLVDDGAEQAQAARTLLEGRTTGTRNTRRRILSWTMQES